MTSIGIVYIRIDLYRTFTVEIKTDDTIADILEAAGYNPRYMSLLYNNTNLHIESPISDCGVTAEMIFDIVKRESPVKLGLIRIKRPPRRFL